MCCIYCDVCNSTFLLYCILCCMFLTPINQSQTKPDASVCAAGVSQSGDSQARVPGPRLHARGAQQELCQWETLEASCGAGQVILLQEAVYGRMKLGRCVKRNFGFLGCEWDALAAVDTHCSGRRSCSFPVTDLHGLHQCPNDLTAYLRLAYTCVTGQYMYVHRAIGQYTSATGQYTSVRGQYTSVIGQ